MERVQLSWCGPIAAVMMFVSTSFGALHAQGIQALCLHAPAGGERLHPGGTCAINWTPVGMAGTVDLSVWNGITATWTQIATGIPVNDGAFVWTIPDNWMIGDRFRVKVTSNMDPAFKSLSRAFFLIVPQNYPFKAEPGRPDATLAGDMAVSVAPNPATDAVNIEWKAEGLVSMRVYDVAGHLVFSNSEIMGSSYRLSTSDLPAGIYVADVRTIDGRHGRSRFVVAR